MEMFSETGQSLVRCTHTFTHTRLPRGMGLLPSVIKRCVLCGARCLCNENITMNNHLSSFKAILILFPDSPVAGTKRV